ncbi:MAG: transglycosylase SLT domain-containing protein [Pseudomonadota bacterium]
MSDEKPTAKPTGYERWMASGVAGAVLVIGVVWYAVSNLTGNLGDLPMVSAAEASSSIIPTGGSPAPSPAPILNKILLTPHPNDPMIIEAYNAFQSKDVNALKAYLDRPTDHPLRDYIGYWYWKRMLDITPLSTEFNDAIQEWIKAHSTTVLAERLRQDWLKKQLPSITPRFLPEYDLLTKPDDELVCAVWLLRGQPLNAKAEEAKMWVSPRELSPACEQWLALRVQKGGEATRLRYRLYLAGIAGNARALARISALSMIQPPNDLAELYSSPIRWLAKNPRLDSVWSVIALLRLANNEAGHSKVKFYLDKLDPNLQKESFAFLGYVLGKRLQPEAIDYFKQGTLSSDLPPEVLSWRLRTFLRESQWKEVLQTTEVVPESVKEQESSWKYWQARALVEFNRVEEAQSIYTALAVEPHYYGVLAKEALGQSWPALTVPAMPTQESVSTVARDASIQRAVILARLDWREEGRREWQWALRDARDEEINAAAYVAWQYQYYDWAINTAARTRKTYNLGLRFLAPYQGIAEQAGQQFQVPSAWVLGIIRQESRFFPRARSGAGALGLMQLMPATAREVAKKTGIEGSTLNALIDPAINIPMGTYYIRELMQRLGSPVRATAAYNAGAGRARAWQSTKPLEGAIYIETIPFNETREYVKRVLSNWYFYHRVLANKSNLTLTRVLGTIPARGEKEAQPWIEDEESAAETKNGA